MINMTFTCNLQETIQAPHTPVTITACTEELHIRLQYSGAYGMGEKYNALNQKGRTVVNRVEEKFCFQGDKTYCPAPFFWTDSGFGLYINTQQVTTFCFNEDEIVVSLPEQTQIIAFTGTPEEIIREYISVFGKPVLPPAWSFGIWASANRWNSQKDVEAACENLRKYDFPASVLVVEAWSDEATFYIFNGAKYIPNTGRFLIKEFELTDSPWPDPETMIKRLKEQGIHLVLWQIPVYKKLGEDEPENRQNQLDREEALRKGLCVKNNDGSSYTIPEGHWFAGSEIPDFKNPATRESWFEKRQYLLDIGVAGFKTDGGEFIYKDDVQFYDGSTGKEGVNAYASDYTKAYSDFIGFERVLFSRAGFAGQHTVPIHWAGDQQSQNCELKSALCAGLSAAATGIIFWSFDLGGFAGPLPTLDLYRRATQLACFCPIMQWHSEPDGGQFKELMAGAVGNNERSPWNMAQSYNCPEFMDEIRVWHKLRERLRPYLWESAQDSVETGKPMMRPLCYVDSQDEKCISCEDEFMLGDTILVAPLLEENQTAREVYLPQGTWMSLYTGEYFEGKTTVYVDEHGNIPVFLDCKYIDVKKLRDELWKI